MPVGTADRRLGREGDAQPALRPIKHWYPHRRLIYVKCRTRLARTTPVGPDHGSDGGPLACPERFEQVAGDGGKRSPRSLTRMSLHSCSLRSPPDPNFPQEATGTAHMREPPASAGPALRGALTDAVSWFPGSRRGRTTASRPGQVPSRALSRCAGGSAPAAVRRRAGRLALPKGRYSRRASNPRAPPKRCQGRGRWPGSAWISTWSCPLLSGFRSRLVSHSIEGISPCAPRFPRWAANCIDNCQQDIRRARRRSARPGRRSRSRWVHNRRSRDGRFRALH
jgi:hypothetical protein